VPALLFTAFLSLGRLSAGNEEDGYWNGFPVRAGMMVPRGSFWSMLLLQAIMKSAYAAAIVIVVIAIIGFAAVGGYFAMQMHS
jgi:hypothetical protein